MIIALIDFILLLGVILSLIVWVSGLFFDWRERSERKTPVEGENK